MSGPTMKDIAAMIAKKAGDERDPAPQGPPDYEGKVEVVFVWASWCGHCKRFKPIFDSIREGVEAADVAADGKASLSFSTVSFEEYEANPDHWASAWVSGFPTIIVKTSIITRSNGKMTSEVRKTTKLGQRGQSVAEFFDAIQGASGADLSHYKPILPAGPDPAALAGGETSLAEGERRSRLSTLGQCLRMSLSASDDPRAKQFLKEAELMACAADADGKLAACMRAKSDPPTFSVLADIVEEGKCKELALQFFDSPEEAHAATKAAIPEASTEKDTSTAMDSLKGAGVVPVVTSH